MSHIIEKMLEQVTQDARTPCEYSGAMLLGDTGNYGGAVVEYNGKLLHIFGEAQRSFLPRRVVVDIDGGAAGWSLERLFVGDSIQIGVSYTMGIAAELLLPSAWPIHWRGVDAILPGHRVQADLRPSADIAAQLEKGVAPPAIRVILLGDQPPRGAR